MLCLFATIVCLRMGEVRKWADKKKKKEITHERVHGFCATVSPFFDC